MKAKKIKSVVMWFDVAGVRPLPSTAAYQRDQCAARSFGAGFADTLREAHVRSRRFRVSYLPAKPAKKKGRAK